MTHTHWQIHKRTGFLLHPYPLAQLNDHPLMGHDDRFVQLDMLATQLSQISELDSINDALKIVINSNYRSLLSQCKVSVWLEKMFAILGYCASTLVFRFGVTTLPTGLAELFVLTAERLNRPPMLSYVAQVLNNGYLINPELGYTPANIGLYLHFTDLIDESWFFRVHIAIEAQAGELLVAMQDSWQACERDDQSAVLAHLRQMREGLVLITRTFHQMPEHCDPDVYYQDVRPYLMSFTGDVVYQGIMPNPTPLRGGSGAQSSIVPAVLAGLGLSHAETGLTHSLQDMRRYMPLEHRQFIDQMQHHPLREYCQNHPPLRDAYNHVLKALITFRRAHLYYARTYIFEKSTNPVGTGGTEYMSFLSKLIDETENQLL